jgi:flagellar biosynthesis/type III secretory pathway protein FliH
MGIPQNDDFANDRFKRKMARAHEAGIEKGLERGIEKGIEKGQLEARRDDLLRLLEKRFGPLRKEQQDQLQEAATEQLIRWFDRAIDAPTLEHVFVE